MKISIVTISFNQAQYLRQCIDSVLSQGIDNIEYIVVDPGSTDGSREIIESYGGKIIKVFEKDAGPADGLNKGFAKATGDVFGFINSDDLLKHGSLNYVSKYFLKNPNVDVLNGIGDFIDENGDVIGLITPSVFSAWKYAYGAVTLFQQGTFFKANAFLNVGGFNPTNKICWDGELFVDMYMAGAKFQLTSSTFASFRMDGNNISSDSAYKLKLHVEHMRIFRKIMNRAWRSTDFYMAIFARLIKIANLRYIAARVLQGNYMRPPHLRLRDK